MFINTKGLVLREASYRDSSKILTILTSDEGKLTASVRGAKRKNSRLAPCAQPLAFSDMTLLKNRDRWTLTEAQGIEFFTGLCEDITLLALGTYIAELLEAVSDEDSPVGGILPLGLNALYVLSEGKRAPELVKAAFELRLMCLAGFAPSLDACPVCGSRDVAAPQLDVVGGAALCGGCRSRRYDAGGEYAELDAQSLQAARYITRCEPKRVFSFALDGESLRKLADAVERYALTHLGRGFKSLDYYKKFDTRGILSI
ncbi:MAG: DNA repair protein RecO [Oscillospiraceae bacterium]|jgi:DNA repair protein RecO (recombination protein O)|nr:DNA repair protein RecO [Oscillospiraceae bacterium]